MTETARLRLPMLAAAQAQKHVTVNEGLLLLDSLVQASVLAFATAPAGGEADGDCYIVTTGASGAFTGWEGRLARRQDGEWHSFLPGSGDGAGWIVWNQDDEHLYVRDNDGDWVALGIQDAMVFAGILDCSGNPNYPAGDRGDTYRVSVAGKVGGGSGPNVEVGDILICLSNGTASGNHATVGAHWSIIQANIDGAVVGPAGATNGHFAQFDGTSGRLIKGGKAAPAGTVVGTSDAQTLTNKTLTSPVINSPSGLVKGDVGLGSVDNTSDANKPISTATQTALDLKAPLASPALTGNPTAPTQTAGTSNTRIATTAFVAAAISAVINAAPGALDTLDELAAALGDDANFAATVTNALAGKLALGGGTMTGPITLPGNPTGALHAAPRQYVDAGLGSLRGFLFGCTIGNSTSDTTNDIDFAAGVCADSTGTVMMRSTAMTKRLDAGWSPGSGNGMRNSAASIANDTYHLYAVSKAGGADPDWYAHTSTNEATVLAALQAESGGSAYLYVRRVASIIRASGTIRGFRQTGDAFVMTSFVTDRNSTSAMALDLLTLTIPLGIEVYPLLYNLAQGSSGLLSTRLQDADQSGPEIRIMTITGTDWASGTPNPVFRSNTSGQIRYAAVISAGGFATNVLYTYGWIDRRGRDA